MRSSTTYRQQQVFIFVALITGQLTHSLFPSSPKTPSSAINPQQTFRIVSWNILAETYAKPEKYPRTSPAFLEWSSRSQRIMSKLQSFNADIVCLQEVQLSRWSEFSAECKKLGYNCDVLQNVTRSYPVALATLYRPEIVEVLAVESRSRALILTVRSLQTQELLFLGNIHFQAGKDGPAEMHRFNQLKSLLRRIQVHAAQHLPRLTPDTRVNVMVMGDFNMNRSSPLYKLLSTHYAMHSSPSVNDMNFANHKLPFLPLVDVYTRSGSYNKIDDCDSETPPAAPRQKPTFRTGCVLDYVFASAHLNALPWIEVDNDLYADAYSKEETLQPQALDWPNAEHPSDHWPIGVNVKI